MHPPGMTPFLCWQARQWLTNLPKTVTIDNMPSKSECNRPLPDSARIGVRLFNEGRYFEAHEALETAWRAERRPIRLLYQGILQVGVCYHHILRGNYAGACRVMERALRCLDGLPDVCQGVRVDILRRDAATALAELHRLGAANLALFDRRLMQPVCLDNTDMEDSHAVQG